VNNSGSYLFITLCCMHKLATRYCLQYRVSKFIIYDFYISLINRGALALVEYIAGSMQFLSFYAAASALLNSIIAMLL